MKKYLFLVPSLFLLSACSDEYEEAERNFIKLCYYGSNFSVSRDLCECSFEKLKDSYSPTEFSTIFSKLHSLDQRGDAQMSDLTDDILKFKDNFKNAVLECK